MAAGIELITPEGRLVRLGPDEHDPWAIPFAVKHRSVIPGGYDTASFSLRVRIDDEVPFSLLCPVRFYDIENNRTVYRGLIAKMPRQAGDDFLIDCQCVGPSAKMKWPNGWRQVYVDQDLGSWHEAPLVRRRAIATGGFPQGKVPVSIGDGITWDPPNEALPALEHSEVAYAMPAGCEIADLGYKGKQTGTWTNFEAPQLLTDDSEDIAGAGAVALTLDDTVRTANVSSPQRYGVLRTLVSTGHTPAAGVQRSYSRLGVYGNHGLTKQAIPGELPGYWGHDLIADIIANASSELDFTTGPDGSIQPNYGFVVPQASFPKPSTGEDGVLEVNKYFIWEWGYYDRFFWRPPDPDRLRWGLRLDQGIFLGLEGDDADTCVNGVLVNYHLPDGTIKTAGPPGSGCDVEDPSLGDSNPLNVVNALGIAAKYAIVDLSFPTIDIGAVAIGAAWLAELSLPARKGTFTVTGEILHPTKGLRPVNETLAGDWVLLSDHPADVPRRVIAVEHDEDKRTAEISVGNDIEKVDAMQQEVGVMTQVAGFS